jgi:hypothetical protein
MLFENGASPQIHVQIYWFKSPAAKSHLQIVSMGRLEFWFAVKIILSTDTWTDDNIVSPSHEDNILSKIVSGASSSLLLSCTK